MGPWMRTAPGAVLIVSAEPAVGEAIRQAVLRLGVSSVVAAGSVDAVQRLAADAPGAIVVDLLFPDMDPEQIVRRALACRETHGSPVVVLGDDSEDRDVWLESGCSAVLRRDADPRDIAREVIAHMRARPQAD